MYNNGGWITNAGSCNMGLKPNPFAWTGIIFSKGLDVKIVNNIKPDIINAWVSKVFEINLEFVLLYN